MTITLDSITTSTRPNKRFTAVFDIDGKQKTVHFGDVSMNTYIDHGDKKRRSAYWSRHRKDLLTNDATKPGYLSFYLLWGPSTSLKNNITYYKKLFNIN